MSTRFYPPLLPAYQHEPTGDHFAIRYIDERQGEGIIALVPFEPGDIVFTFTGFLVSEVTQFSLRLADDLHVHDPYFYGKLLHSCDPNMSCEVSTRTFTAIKPIAVSEPITMDYETTEAVLFRAFECSCGAPTCRGLIKGYAAQ